MPLIGDAVDLIGDGGRLQLCGHIIPTLDANGADVSTLVNGGRGGNNPLGTQVPIFIGYPIVST